jgi:hypothetical protein
MFRIQSNSHSALLLDLPDDHGSFDSIFIERHPIAIVQATEISGKAPFRGPVRMLEPSRLEADPMGEILVRERKTNITAINADSGRSAGRRRRVIVRVLDGPREVDRFQSSSGTILREAVRPVYRHVARNRLTVQFTGVEEETLPLGIRRTRREIPLANFGDALMFLAA